MAKKSTTKKSKGKVVNQGSIQMELHESANGNLTTQSLTEYVASAMLDYGTEVLEERAVPDFRDGCKPVHRMVIHAMNRMGTHSVSKFTKSARTVGEVIGKFHPHGDGSTYDAMVGIAGTKSSDKKVWKTKNANIPLVEGFGNWGDFIDNAAAYRYTESRLSKFADMLLLDKAGLDVIEYVPNFSNDEKVPLILPSKLPLILLNGSEGIAVGVSIAIPSFALPGVIKLTKKALSGQEVTLKDCVKNLEFVTAYGGNVISGPKERKAVMEGKGTVEWLPEYEFNAKERRMSIISACPGMMSEKSIETFFDNVLKIKGVSDIVNNTGKQGVRYDISFKKGLDDYAQKEVVEKILKISVRRETYDIGVSIRGVETTKFGRASVPQIFRMWAEWRVDLELKIIKNLIRELDEKIARQELFLKAIDNLDIIFKALRLKEDPTPFLMKKMKISEEDAKFILDMKVRQLQNMERAKVLKHKKELETEKKDLVKQSKKPADRALKALEQDEPVLLKELGK